MSKRKIKDLTGLPFGKWTVIRKSDKLDNGHVCWVCRCECGEIQTIRGTLLRTWLSIQCSKCTWVSFSEAYKLPQGEAGFRRLLKNYKNSAAKRTITFSLSDTRFRELTSSVCWYCGKPPEQLSKPTGSKNKLTNDNGIYVYNGIDRMDNTRGYEEGNVVSCCKKHNSVKSKWGREDIKLVHDGIEKFYKLPTTYLPCQTGVCQ
jgi:hypothetical protein